MGRHGHGEAIIENIADARDRQVWKEIASEPFPTVLLGYQGAGDISRKLKKAGMIYDADGWRAQMGYTNDDQPVQGAIYVTDTLHHALDTDSSIHKHAQEKQRRIQQELKDAGCNTAAISHVVYTPTEIITQYALFHPDQALNTLPAGPGDDPTAYDMEGRTLMLAYLLQTGKITREEVTKKDEPSRFHKPFGLHWVAAAEQPNYQNAVRKALQLQTSHADRLSENGAIAGRNR